MGSAGVSAQGSQVGGGAGGAEADLEWPVRAEEGVGPGAGGRQVADHQQQLGQGEGVPGPVHLVLGGRAGQQAQPLVQGGDGRADLLAGGQLGADGQDERGLVAGAVGLGDELGPQVRGLGQQPVVVARGQQVAGPGPSRWHPHRSVAPTDRSEPLDDLHPPCLPVRPALAAAVRDDRRAGSQRRS